MKKQEPFQECNVIISTHGTLIDWVGGSKHLSMFDGCRLDKRLGGYARIRSCCTGIRMEEALSFTMFLAVLESCKKYLTALSHPTTLAREAELYC